MLTTVSPSERYTINPDHITALPHLGADDLAQKLVKAKSNHYQCAWIGPELIWNGELVRVSLHNDEEEEKGLPSGQLPRSAGAKDRSFFLSISSIYRVAQDANGNQIPARAHASGTLYELQDLATVTSINGAAGSSAMQIFENRPAGQPAADNPTYMPTPPTGFAFRCINPPGTNYGCELDIIAGRYYPLPAGFSRAMVDEVIKQYQADLLVEEPEYDEKVDLARRQCVLAGLLPPEIATTVRCSPLLHTPHTDVVL